MDDNRDRHIFHARSLSDSLEEEETARPGRYHERHRSCLLLAFIGTWQVVVPDDFRAQLHKLGLRH
jgi:hypothetical protein